MGIDRRFFFDNVRSALFSGALRRGQVDGLTALLDAWEERRSDLDPRWLAYGLATAFHETAFAMQPVRERGSDAYCEARYGIAGSNPKRAADMGNTTPGDGARYRGRGFVQLTFRNNYACMASHLSRTSGRRVDLVGDPELACRLDYAVEILFFGLESGAFTGHGLPEFFRRDGDGRSVREAWVGARAIVNGRDRADDIAAYGRAFLRALGGRPLDDPASA